MKLDLKLDPKDRWPTLFEQLPDLADDWLVMLRSFERELAVEDEWLSSLVGGPVGSVARKLMGWLNPCSGLFSELNGAADYLGVSRNVAWAAQLVYDASTTDRLDAQCGCTSAAAVYRGKAVHGRNLDWGWPEEIAGRIWQIEVVGEDGSTYTMEHIPGCVGMTAAWMPGVIANLNQAPTGTLRRSRLPALWWFRRTWEAGCWQDLAEDRSIEPPPPGMSDALIHVTGEDRTIIIGYSDGEINAECRPLFAKPLVLANAFTATDCEDSLRRVKRIGRMKKTSRPAEWLQAVAHGFTVHSVVVDVKTGRGVCV